MLCDWLYRFARWPTLAIRFLWPNPRLHDCLGASHPPIISPTLAHRATPARSSGLRAAANSHNTPPSTTQSPRGPARSCSCPDSVTRVLVCAYRVSRTYAPRRATQARQPLAPSARVRTTRVAVQDAKTTRDALADDLCEAIGLQYRGGDRRGLYYRTLFKRKVKSPPLGGSRQQRGGSGARMRGAHRPGGRS